MLLGLASSTNSSTMPRFGKIYQAARVAKLADALDLGLRNRRFQNVALRFKKESFYERKTRVFTK